MNGAMLTLAVWLLHFLVHSTILLGAVWLIDRFRLVRSSALREQLWRAAVFGGLLTATAHTAGLPTLTPRIAFAVTSHSAGSNAGAPPVPPRAPLPLDSLAPAAGGSPGQETATAVRPFHPAPPESATAREPGAPRSLAAPATALARALSKWPNLFVMLSFAGAAFALSRTGLLALRMRRDLGPRLAVDAEVRRDLEALCHGSFRVPALTVSARIASPITLPNGEIVVPPWTLIQLERRQRRALLAHELAHVARRDPQ